MPDIAPTAAPLATLTPSVQCTLCGAAPVAHWCRRPTAAELNALVAATQQKFGDAAAVPTATDTAVTVYACAVHAIQLEAAAQVHEATCTAPCVAHLPGCDCTPEPPPPAAPPGITTTALTTGWVVPAPPAS
ncbi:hypothetical protein [Kitasatospora sp. NBC_01302]|uniref:hypothetical protein n=1 Tax=Kitasatospora sp. NBC_01302 TaxID=2903575 RepID=UPI002E13848D|nr:hypothetical protein OG294_14450 [Kitasatospora sp. NBC_01302]